MSECSVDWNAGCYGSDNQVKEHQWLKCTVVSTLANPVAQVNEMVNLYGQFCAS